MSLEKALAIVMGILFVSMFGAVAVDKYTERKYMTECVKNHTPIECQASLK